ncbi:TetR/AcrR family transcriptional regulator [Actinoallomurus purpureus]|uniref:TetR/AcrR family transcriptional regulator n=1 Tax=Actinoallomurus purpureus TaxID=478114 RepID=UPI002093AC7B|nr:TetR/AcrR family transcriptional regulator C-terminal domain-containing protein [Actinoallomurus purpureus]MCO6003728.1 TetR/AcrR family transcriptional regulator [Actinoallomurus purpureus]
MTPDDRDDATAPEQRVTIWERLDRPGRGPRPTLTHDQIARAGVEIADEQGLDAVSMRRLAERLGVATMALYRYVSSKDDLLELMIDAVSAEIELPPDAGWRDLARSFAHQLRAVGLRHPWLTAAFARVPHALTPNLIARVEDILHSLDGLALDVDAMMAVFGTVNAFVRGATAGEVVQREAARKEGRESEEETKLAHLPYVRWLMGLDRYPTLTRYIIEGSNEDDAQWQFEFGLECVLDGIGTRLGI